MDYTNDTEIFQKVTQLMDKLEKNQQLQHLAIENGIDTKNAATLTAATKENIAVSVISLLLAKRDNDPRYRDLVRYGMDHRRTKVDIINDYKNQANALITKYKNGERPESVTVTQVEVESFYDESVFDMDIEPYFQEGTIGKTILIGAVVALSIPLILIASVIALIIRIIDSFLGLFTRVSPDKLLRKIKRLSPEKKARFTFVVENCDPKILKEDSFEFMEMINQIRVFADQCDNALGDGDTAGKTIKKACADLKDKLTSRNVDTAVDIGLGIVGKSYNTSVRTQLDYEETVEFLTDLARLDMKALKAEVSRLKRLMKRFEDASKDAKDTESGMTKSGINDMKKTLNESVAYIQAWTRARDRILRKSDIVIDAVLAGINRTTKEYEKLTDDMRKIREERERKEKTDKEADAWMGTIDKLQQHAESLGDSEKKSPAITKPERRPGETDAEYKYRWLTGKELKDIDDLEVRWEYGDKSPEVVKAHEENLRKMDEGLKKRYGHLKRS